MGDLAEGVALANRVGLGGSLVGGGVGAADGEGQDPAGTKEVVSLAVEEAGVEGGDLGVAASVAEFGGCDRPQRLAALDGVLPGLNRRRRVLDGVRRRVGGGDLRRGGAVTMDVGAGRGSAYASVGPGRATNRAAAAATSWRATTCGRWKAG